MRFCIELLSVRPASTSSPSWSPPSTTPASVVNVTAVVVAFVTVRWLLGNLTTNLDEQGIPTGWDFLDNPAGFAIRDSPTVRRQRGQ